MADNVPVTGGTDRFPVFDRHGTRIHVGDTLRAKVCTGPYGQTKIVTAVVTDAHWQYCQMNVPGNLIGTAFDFKARVLRCYHKHEDYEHGHETWAEVVKD